MAVLWMNLFMVFLSSFMARYFSKPLADSITYVKPNKLLILISMFSLVMVSGLRNNIGDTYFYMHSYFLMEDSNLQNIKLEGEFGFNILQSILRSISDDPQLLVFTTALITNVLIVITLYKYSRMIELSLYVYIASGLYTVSMNGIRQSLAAAMIFLATKYIIDGNFKKFLFVVLLASTIHQSALIFIPVYFIVRRKAWTRDTYILLGLGVLVVAAFNEFSQILFSALEDTKYGEYSEVNEGGSSLLRVAVNATPLVIAFFGKEKLRELWPQSDYIVNLVTLGVVFLIIATKNWIFARFNIYFGLYSLILVSWLVVLMAKQDRKFVYYSILICYLIFYIYEQVIALEIVYRSDYLIW
ncbi:EpsG family protein [Bacillus sp. V3B]|uniref:EpsG family protein n=1 Tax=Bacillus sp. V3B TaxID=2804915 RepID=UPI00210BDE16|nr:EpsG family protein [Bacillus sp. V3B]MCQ6275281.1 EpsG family protein [Bacillus sp. V3B]